MRRKRMTKRTEYKTIPSNTMLYRAALTVETHPTPRFCSDTEKTGVYFSMNHPWLSENMVIEYDTDLLISVYKTTEPITVAIGKYNSSGGSHIEPEIIPLNDYVNTPHGEYYQNHPAIELFLTHENLSKIEYVGCYFRTVKEATEIWCRS